MTWWHVVAQGEDKAKKRSNPHKFLLYRPTFSQFLVFLSTAFKAPHPPPPRGQPHEFIQCI